LVASDAGVVEAVSGVDLVQWLGARLDEDTARATAAIDELDGPSLGADWRYDGRSVETVRERTMVAVGSQDFMEPGVGTHIAEWDPARVLREIDAKRKLLALLPELEQADRLIAGEWGSSDDLAEKLLDALLSPYPKCGATTVFWPDDEACDAVCVWPRGHGGTRHQDETLGGWDETELTTSHQPE
jgi:hypothetical protein